MSYDREQQVRVDINAMENVDALPSGLLVPHYLIHSCIYYKFNSSLISDAAYDRLAHRLFDEWDNVEHLNKWLIHRDALKTSGFYIQYPIRVQETAKYLLSHIDMSINARSKGQRGEREIIDMLQPHINQVSVENNVQPPQLLRNQMQSAVGGYDIVGLPMFAIEVKRVEKDTDGAQWGWWVQAVRQATTPEVEPILFYRMNKKAWKVMLFSRLDLGNGKRLKVPSIIKVEDFITYMKWRLHNHQLQTKVTN